MLLQTNLDEITCPDCNTKNVVTNTNCNSCGRPLNTLHPESPPAVQRTDSTIGEIVVGAALVVGAAYGMWKALSGMTEDWVVGTVAFLPHSPRLVRSAQEQLIPGTAVGIDFGNTGIKVPYYQTRRIPAEYGPPTAQFIFTICEYPSGTLPQSADDLDILWRSEEFLNHDALPQMAPVETARLRTMVDNLVQMAKKDGWASAGHGDQWFQYRLRKRYDQVGVQLKWN